ncbi:hypothetical protein PTKIN_Ptkin16aG0477300 [Pterospermum kingtungense]
MLFPPPLHGVGNILYKDFMIQGRLPYGKIGEWRFDKRSFDSIAPPRNLPLPPSGVPESVRKQMEVRQKQVVEFPWRITRRSAVEGPIGEPVEITTSSLVLAAERTYRKDPLNGFKRYTGGWNIRERHYWAVS